MDPALHILDYLGVVVVVDIAGAVVERLAFRPDGVVGDFREVLFQAGLLCWFRGLWWRGVKEMTKGRYAMGW